MNSASHVTYRIISAIIFIIAVIYLGLSQFFMRTNLGVGSGWQRFFTGPARLEFQENVLKVKIKADAKILEFGFLSKIRECPKRPKGEDYFIECSSELDWMTIRAAKRKSLQNTAITITMLETPGPVLRRHIKLVRLDQQEQNIPHFFYNFLDRSASNLTLH